MPAKPIVNVVDDDPDVRQSLEVLLQHTPFHAKLYSSAEDFLIGFDPETPGCLLLDVLMPDMDGLTLQGVLSENNCELPVIIMSGHADVPMAVRALEAGASSFIEKPFRRQDLLERIEKAIQQDLANRQKLERDGELEQRILLLTTREYEIVEMVVDGKLSKQIASALKISPRTVEAHRANIMRKLKVETLAELVALAIECGIRSSDSLDTAER